MKKHLFSLFVMILGFVTISLAESPPVIYADEAGYVFEVDSKISDLATSNALTYKQVKHELLTSSSFNLKILTCYTDKRLNIKSNGTPTFLAVRIYRTARDALNQNDKSV